MPKKAVLFDLDGTLLNSLPDISRCMNTVLEKHGLSVYPMLDYRYMTGNGALKLTQRALGEAHQELEQTVLAEYAALYAKHCYDESYLYPGIADMMQDLKAAGYRLVVLSNKDDPDVASVLNHYFDEPPFTVMRGHLPGVPLKPDPAAALNIAKELGIAPADFWYLGDTPTDLATCRGAGMNFIAVAWGFRSRQELSEAGAERIVDTPAQALEYMLK